MTPAWIAVFGVLLAAANLAGGALLILPRRLRQNNTLLRYFIALGAGFMLAAVFIEILPQTLAAWFADSDSEQSSHAMAATATSFVLAGYLVVHTCEYLFGTHLHPAPADPEHRNNVGARQIHAALGGLAVHTFFDGVTIATGFLVEFNFGMLIFVAVLLHKIPEGMTAASILLASGRAPRAAMLATAAVASTTLIGVAAVLLLPLNTNTVIKYALPFSAGITLYIAASDLIPELTHHRHRRDLLSPLFVIGGVLLFYLLHLAVGH